MKRLPATVLLSCIEYRISETEGLIVFSQHGGCWGTSCRITFERDGDGMCWYVKILSSNDNQAMFSHVEQAMKMVEDAYGKNFENKPMEAPQ